MARLVNMQPVVAEEIHFDMGDGTIYRINGKLPVQQWLTLAHLEQRMLELGVDLQAATTASDDDEYLRISDEILAVLDELCAMVLKVLQVHQPELEACPFDEDQILIFMREMRAYFEQKLGPDPTPPSATPGTEKTVNRAARRASTSSSGSRASRSSSAGRPTTGAS